MADNNDERIDPLLKKLADKNEDSLAREMTACSLGEIIGDPRTVEPLINTLKDEDGDIRWMAAKALGKIGDKRAVEPLIKTLGDEDEDVRREAARSLEKIFLSPADCQKMNLIPLLIANVLTSKDEDIRNISMSLLRKCRGLE